MLQSLIIRLKAAYYVLFKLNYAVLWKGSDYDTNVDNHNWPDELVECKTEGRQYNITEANDYEVTLNKQIKDPALVDKLFALNKEDMPSYERETLNEAIAAVRELESLKRLKSQCCDDY